MPATDSRTGWVAPTLRAADVEVSYGDFRRPAADQAPLHNDFSDEPKWPAWKVTLAVVFFCGAFWAGIGYLAVRLLG